MTIYTVSQAAEILGVKSNALRTAIYNGQIEAFKHGRDWRITETALKEYIRNNNVRISLEGAKKYNII